MIIYILCDKIYQNITILQYNNNYNNFILYIKHVYMCVLQN